MFINYKEERLSIITEEEEDDLNQEDQLDQDNIKDSKNEAFNYAYAVDDDDDDEDDNDCSEDLSNQAFVKADLDESVDYIEELLGMDTPHGTEDEREEFDVDDDLVNQHEPSEFGESKVGIYAGKLESHKFFLFRKLKIKRNGYHP